MKASTLIVAVLVVGAGRIFGTSSVEPTVEASKMEPAPAPSTVEQQRRDAAHALVAELRVLASSTAG